MSRDTFIDEDGVEHDWDEQAPCADCEEVCSANCPRGCDCTEGEPYTYRDLAIDVAGSTETYATRAALKRGETEDLTPPWVDDDEC